MIEHKNIRQKILKDIIVSLLAVCLMFFFVIVAISIKPLNPIKRALENFSFTDIYYEILNDTGEPDTSRIITIVDLTRLTNRSDIAKTINDIATASPKIIGIDCCFDNIGEDVEGNERIIDVAQKHSNIVWAYKLLDHSDSDNIGWTKEIHSFFTNFTDVCEGTVNMPRSLYDPTKRTIPLKERSSGKECLSFPSQIVNAYTGKHIEDNHPADIDINFSPIVFNTLQPEEITSHKDLIENQIVLLGSLYEDADTHWTPLGKMAGVELLAYSIQTLIYNKEVQTLNTPLYMLATFILVLFTQMWQEMFIEKTQNSHNIFVRYLIGSSYVMNLLITLVSFVLIGFSFFTFKYYNVSFNMAWALSIIAFLSTSRLMYKSLSNYFQAVAQDKNNKQV